MSDYAFAPVPLIPDEPVDDLKYDYLGLMPWAKMIAGSVVGTRGPFTIGVHAQWGYGKTSLLKLTKALIDESENGHSDVVTVWFNAWQFEREEHPLFSLIAAIADEIDKKTKENPALTALKSIGTSIRALTRGMKFHSEVGLPLIGEVGAEFDAQKALEAEELIGGQSNPLQGEMMYHSAFEMLRGTAESHANAKIAVFIDDLDRCQPDKAVALLESIKLILSQPGFVFVLAVDPQPIEGFLQKRYCSHFGCEEGDWGKFYMEKIIQLPIIIPNHRTRFADYVRNTVDSLAARNGGSNPAIDALKVVRDDIATGAGNNPRTFVRLVNNFLLDCSLWPLIERKGDKMLEGYRNLDADVAAALAFNRILQHFLGELFLDLIRDQELCDAICHDKLEGAFPEKKTERLEDGVAVLRGEEPPTRAAIAGKLLRRKDLLAALREHGSKWLQDEALRIAVNEFAQAQRPDVVSGLPEPISEAIREALGLEPDEPIPANRLSEVTKLVLHGTQGTDGALAHLKPLTGLTQLYLYGTRVTDAGVAHLKSLTGLNALDLSDTRVTNLGLAHLKSLTGLTQLYLTDTRVTDAGLAHLKSLTGLNTLSLNNTLVTDAGLVYLKSLTGLTALYLRGTQVPDAGLAHLKSLTGLTELDLSGTQVRDAGLAHLESLTGLTRLDLSGTQVRDAGLAHLESLTGLICLDLSGTRVTDAGLAHLKSLTGLTTLSLGGTQVTDAGLAHLKSLTGLTRLGLWGTQVTDAGVAHLKSLTGLNTLSLTDTLVTDAGVAELKAAIPGLTIYR